VRCIKFLRLLFFRIPNFGIGIPISQFFIGIRENFSAGIFGIKNGSGIPLPMGVPEIGNKKLEFPTKEVPNEAGDDGLSGEASGSL
jgi:hypothetical protein